MQRAVQKTGYADFWELYKRNNLPGETKNYVPEILAAIIIANHPTQYGFDDVTLDPPVLTDTVTINYSVDLRLVSDLVDAPVDELMALNPSLLRMATPPDTSFDLHLPAGTAALFQQRIAAIPESKRNAWRYHRVTADDTLASVARTYRVTVAELAAANQLERDGRASTASRRWWCPCARPPRRRAHAVSTPRAAATRWSRSPIASVSRSIQLRRWNKIPAGVKVEPGRRLHVAEPAGTQRIAGHGKAGSRHASTRGHITSRERSAAKHPPALLHARSKQLAHRASRPLLASSGTCESAETRMQRSKNRSGALLHTCLLIAFACKLLLQWLPHAE